MNRPLLPGNIVSSPEFAFGHYGMLMCDEDLETYPYDPKKPITVGGYHKGEMIVNFTHPKTNISTKKDVSADDPSRGEALFVVVFAEFDGGGTGMGAHDIYPDGWHIIASRLNEEGRYDPNSELIDFYLSGSFNNLVRDIKTHPGNIALPQMFSLDDLHNR